jgi:putative Holliday junction resolvase
MMEKKGRILAIDYGSKRVGLAVSDPMRIIAQGAGTIENDPALFERLARIVNKEGITLIVVGMPYAPDGGVGGKGEEIQRFVSNLREAVPAEIEMWDESFSSVRAHEVFRETGMRKRQRREKHRVDEMAARLMLQEYLESNDYRQ